MVERILLFKRQSVCYDTMNIFAAQLERCLKEQGIAVSYLDLTSPTLEQDVLALAKQHFDAAIAFNSLGQEAFRANGEYLFDYLQIPFFNYIVDHPLRHHHTLSTPLSNYHVICLDEDHASYIRTYYPHIRSVHVIPLGGMYAPGDNPDFSKTLEDFARRPYDIILTGSYYALTEIEEKIDLLPELERNLTISLIETMLSRRTLTNEAALLSVLEDLDVGEVKPQVFADLMAGTNLAGHYVNACVREEAVWQLLAEGIELHIFGNGWEKFLEMNHRKGGNFRQEQIHPGVSYETSLQLAAQSKMVLNTMPWFKNGMHDRIATAMLNGAVAVTDGSGYLSRNFAAGEELLVYSIEDYPAMAAMVSDSLQDMEKLFEIAGKGRQKAKNALDWKTRTVQILQAIYEVQKNS
ncbi:MAG: glycosyltransferase [Lachnospiraceae bacterium]|nr:glycosyltransferase [Lachnospiraceae bacterium]